MNIYRFLWYVVLAISVILLVVLVEMLLHVSGTTMTPEVRHGLVVLILVLLLALLLLLLLWCLARAKERLSAKKRLYREAHGRDQARRESAAAELAERLARRLPWLQTICDALVRRKFPRPCLQLPIDVTRRPDPCIYDQFYLMANGQSVTWDNPNVDILLGGVPQDSYNLAAATTYQVRVGIENASAFFDALGTNVVVNWLSFGVGGTTATPITAYVLDVPAATPFPGVQRTFPWTTPATAGHYCIQVLITHPDDVNPGNNEGWNNTVVKAIQPGQEYRLLIPVWNARWFARNGTGNAAWRKRLADVRLTVDSYALPPRDSLPTNDVDALFARRPAQWGATVTPAQLTIVPGTKDEHNAEFAVRVPANAPHGTRMTFNVSATAGGLPLGGVTIHLDVQ
jgi:uncharacterized membrane protein